MAYQKWDLVGWSQVVARVEVEDKICGIPEVGFSWLVTRRGAKVDQLTEVARAVVWDLMEYP